MKCPACQHNVDEGDRFCRDCGAALGPRASAATGSATIADLASEYAATLADAPEDATAQYNLALALLYQGNYGEAAANLAAVVEREPEFADAYEKLAIALQKLGDTPGAVAALGKATQLAPDNERLRAALERLARG
ncbi:MAG: tetratricopeptide repeat protein [Armatimonadota bacterium]|jgi:Flp pilus assembly protein TadD